MIFYGIIFGVEGCINIVKLLCVICVVDFRNDISNCIIHCTAGEFHKFVRTSYFV